MKQTILALLNLFLLFRSEARGEGYVNNVFKGTRLVNFQSANLVDNGQMLLNIQHRFGDISGGAYQFFGLDEASMRLGFDFGISDNINLGIGRSTYLKTYDTFGKFRITRQSENFPVTAVISVSGSLPTMRGFFPGIHDAFSDKLSGGIHLHLSGTYGNFGVQLSPGYVKTGYIPFRDKNFGLYVLGVGGSVKLSGKISANLEYMHNFTEDFGNKMPLSAGIDIDTGRHLFQLIVSNSQRMTDQSVLVDTSGNWLKGKLFFGFNLIREFTLKYEQ